jgi:hypothetical protein
MFLRVTFLFSLVLISVLSYSQEKNNSWKSFPTSTDTIKQVGYEGILEDEKIDENQLRHATIKPGSSTQNASSEILKANKQFQDQSKINPTIKGYTILLYSGSGANSKLKARNTLMKFEQLYPDCITHLAWKSPNYEVRIGDFRTKLEAEKLLKTIGTDFPTAFVKTDMIELPPLEKQFTEMELTPKK